MIPTVHPTATIHALVKLGANIDIEAYCLLGEAPSHEAEYLVLGDDCRIRSHTVIYRGTTLGSHCQTGHNVLIRENTVFGDHCSIGSGSVIEHHVTTGHHVRIHSQVFVPEFTTLGHHCWLGPGVKLTNAKYPQSAGVKDNLIGPTIGDYAIIGAGAIVLPGIDIGPHAVVGAGAVVAHHVPEFAIVVGNPAKVIASVRDMPEYAERIQMASDILASNEI